MLSSQQILTVTVRDGTLTVDMFGVGDKERPVLLCLHGWTLDKHSFGFQRDLLEFDVTLATFDRRGFGDSRLSPNFSREVADLRAVISAIGRPVVLYGVSQGARLALRFALNGCEGLRGLVLQGGHIDGLQVAEDPKEAIPFDRYRHWLSAGELQRFRADWLAHPLMRRGCESVPPEVMSRLVESYRGADLLSENALPSPMDVGAKLETLGVPLLVVPGEHEVSSRWRHTEVLAGLANAQSVVIEGGGHLCNVSHPGAVNRAIGGWLATLSGSPPHQVSDTQGLSKALPA